MALPQMNSRRDIEGGAVAQSVLVHRQETGEELTVPSNTPFLLEFTSSEGNTDMWSLDEPSKLIALADDYYNANFIIAFEDVEALSDRHAYIVLNGTTEIGRSTHLSSTGLGGREAVLSVESGPVFMSAGEYVEAYCLHNAGTDPNVGGPSFPLHFGLERVICLV